jgi:hypothetical protein
LDVLGDAGKTSRTALILKRVSATTTAPSGFKYIDLDAPQYWLVTGSISESKWRKGVRKPMYKLASQWLGYYDGEQPAFAYDDEHNLLLRVLFKTEQNALQFDNDVQNETITDVSTIRNLEVITDVTGINRQAVSRRIYQHHYNPDEYNSPEEGLSMVSGTTSILDASSPIKDWKKIQSLVVITKRTAAISCQRLTAINTVSSLVIIMAMIITD